MQDWLILIVYVLTAYGVSNHFVYAHGPAHMYDKIRDVATKIHSNLGELFSCMICFPTWIGMLASIGNMLIIPSACITPFMMLLYGIAPWWIIMILDGFFTSSAVWLIDTWQSAKERSGTNEQE